MYPQTFWLLLALTFGSGVKHKKPDNQFFLHSDRWDKPQPITTNKEKNVALESSIEVTDFTLITQSGYTMPITFIDRHSDTVLVLGQGLPAPKESMLVYAKLFDTYDVILFDYSWNDRYATELLKSTLLCRPVQNMLLDRQEEVYTVLDFIKKHKNYKNVVGLGECYSNFLFTKIQADITKKEGQGPFTHLVLDSCWHSLRLFAERIFYDPYLPLSPQVGGAPTLLKAISNAVLVRWPLMQLIFMFLPNVTLEQYLSALDIPVLFVHGRNDLFVPQKHFAKIWNAAPKNKRVLLSTPYNHANNLGNKQVYKKVAEEFIETSSLEQFLESFEEYDVL